jgi:hypothetical protein
MSQITLDLATRLAYLSMTFAAVRAEQDNPGFTDTACVLMLSRLRVEGWQTGEQLVDYCRESGLTPRDDRAFGAAFKRLLRKGVRVVGTCPRRKGHGSAGGKIYGL